MNAVFIETVGLAAPGLPSWRKAAATLRGEQPFVDAPLPPHTTTMLPPNERRRATPAIRLAFQAAEDAMRSTSLPASSLATIFASADADIAIIHRICLALTVTPRLISPTEFHNSVYNAAAGYWSIAAAARAPSTTISAQDGSFAAGLLEAFLQARVDDCDALLVAFDLPAPGPLQAQQIIAVPAAVSLVLTRRPTAHSLAVLTCATTSETETTLAESALESLRLGSPAARALPLLQKLALGIPGRVVLPMTDHMRLDVELRSP